MPDETRDSDHFRRAVELARGRLGVASGDELRSLGIPSSTIPSWLRAGRLIRLYRGVYAVGHDALRQEGRWRAALLAHGEESALSHATAVVVLALGNPWGRLIDVTVPGSRRKRPGVRLHLSRRLDPADVTRLGLLRVTTPTRTLIDITKTHPVPYVEDVAAAAERRNLIDMARIGEGAPPVLCRILGVGPKLTRAKIERRLLDAVRAAGLPEPETNEWLTHGGGEQWSPDFLYRRELVIVELDDDSHKTTKAFELDRRKDSVRQIDGWATPRFTFDRIQHDLGNVIRELATLLARRNAS